MEYATHESVTATERDLRSIARSQDSYAKGA